MKLGTQELRISVSLGDLRHLTTAEGYAELGMYGDAEEELRAVSSMCRHLIGALGYKLCVCTGPGNVGNIGVYAVAVA
jgi:hypothetical protein